MHQGYEFDYFQLDGNDDPRVYHYVEVDDLPTLSWESFSSFLKLELKQSAEAVIKGW